MKIAFFSNFMNHHQLPFCKAMVDMLGDDFTFVATEPFDQSVVSKGYTDMNSRYDFVLRSYESEAAWEKAKALALYTDVMVLGSAPEEFLQMRLKNNRTGITFRYSERIWREANGHINFKNINIQKRFLENLIMSRIRPYYLLAAGVYTPNDYVRYGFSAKNIYKWGYFPRESTCSLEEITAQKAKKLRIIWVGRMLELKHPEQALEVAGHLKEHGVDYELCFVGDGPLLESLKAKTAEYDLSDWVSYLGSLPAEQVRSEMEKSHIHLFTSDHNEGWGAVLNESMASACVPVTSVQAGASCYLVQQGKNGFIYDGTVEQLCKYVGMLVSDPEKMRRMQRAAYDQIANCWNARQAAKNLIQLSESLLHGMKNPVSEGPCSKAENVTQKQILLYN